MSKLSTLGLFFAGMIVALGTAWAFQRGGKDFNVFYQAWSLVLNGRGVEVYMESPDRFLYAPGFAWVLAPLALLPRDLALALWCLVKAASIGLVIRAIASRLTLPRFAALGICAWSVVFVARPLLIDFQYGQVNLLIFSACIWALLTHFNERASARQSGLAWGVLAVAALSKIFPLPLLIVPFLVTTGISPKRIKAERIGIVSGLALIFLIPFLTESFSQWKYLLWSWKNALQLRGFPLESHNQSFAALLYHYGSGIATHVISKGPSDVLLGAKFFSLPVLGLLSMFWSFSTMGFLLGWIVSGSSKSPLRWLAVAIALVIIPSHLVWKPYFIFGMPLVVLVLEDFYRTTEKRSLEFKGTIILVVFFLMNFSGFDFIGEYWSGRLESASIFLICHCVLLVLVLRSRQLLPSRALGSS